MEEGTALAQYMEPYLSAAELGTRLSPRGLSTVWQVIRWPLLAVLCSFSVVGLIGIPILLVVRGFFLAFAAAVFVRVFGLGGELLSLLLLGGGAVLGVPVLFVLGTQALSCCRALAGRLSQSNAGQERIYDARFVRRCGVCAAVLLVAIVWEQVVIPAVLPWLAGVV